MRSNSPRGIFLAALLTCTLWFSTWAAAGEAELSRIVVFGDSLTDPGNAFVLTHQVSAPPYQLIPDFPYARGGHHFSNGKTWVEQLARRLDMSDSACPALRARGRCSNYAVGGARARPGTPFDLSSQVAMFRSDFASLAKDEAFYVVHIGGNDLRDAIEALASDRSGAATMAIIEDALGAIATNIATLAAAGGREFLVVNAPNLALAPAIRLQGPQAQGAAQFVSVAFNDTLASVLAGLEASLPVTIHRFDLFALVNAAVAAPAAFGLTVVDATCITPGVIVHAECTHPDSYLFWDGIHPTRAAHAILARRVRDILGVLPFDD
ncbi:MAG: SGNH/GDSL hydrolase family protein [Betaproteobacteria bacterium]|nr:MAG: SGNH/GDSL hydrolase family protein [Betaproteobacteria bacterium]